jgi:hypothetical protein
MATLGPTISQMSLKVDRQGEFTGLSTSQHECYGINVKYAHRGLWNVEDLKAPNAIGSNVHFRSESGSRSLGAEGLLNANGQNLCTITRTNRLVEGHPRTVQHLRFHGKARCR